MSKPVTVTKLNSYLKSVFEHDGALKNISVLGEASNVNYHGSGHIYFTLKDENAAIPAVMFRGNRGGLMCDMKAGDKVVVTGRISMYEADGKVQIYAAKIEAAGVGDLAQRFEQLKKELEEMGMFDSSYKQPVPPFVRNLGVVTSPTGAAVQDICRIARQRYGGIRIVVYPALVQGEGAAASIARGIGILDNMNLDAIIVGRGGGSLEDLWAFNERIVAEAIFNAKTPIVSGVGHETDTTIADFVADARASTPSHAAQICVFDASEIRRSVSEKARNLQFQMEKRVSDSANRLDRLGLKLAALSPRGRLEAGANRLSELEFRMKKSHPSVVLKDRKWLFEQLIKRLDASSPVKKLSSGFSYVTDEKGRNIKDSSQLKEGDTISILLAKGSIKAGVTEIEN